MKEKMKKEVKEELRDEIKIEVKEDIPEDDKTDVIGREIPVYELVTSEIKKEKEDKSCANLKSFSDPVCKTVPKLSSNSPDTGCEDVGDLNRTTAVTIMNKRHKCSQCTLYIRNQI